MSSVFATIKSAYPTWDAFRAYLTSAEGGNLSVISHDEHELAVIRYVKGVSNMALPHVGAFRSVVWDTARHVPVSVTPFKSEQGESAPQIADGITVEEFADGVLIGQFWDRKTESWRVHTRSTLDARCRYFSKRSFSVLFYEALGPVVPNLEVLDTSVCYSWVLSHPENRIVCEVPKPAVTLVGQYRVAEDASFVEIPREETPAALAAALPKAFSTTDVMGTLGMMAAMNGSLKSQGIVMKCAGQPMKRWKLRSQLYKTVRHMRGNQARLDFLWMDMWSKGTLNEYLRYYPEERSAINSVVNRWKAITQDVFKIYTDVFKARTAEKSTIPAKYRPLVYGVHNMYMNVLKPQGGRSVTWADVVKHMNGLDTAQKIFVLNWDLRQERSAESVPIEPTASSTA
jgi:hypothetical protein